MMLTEEQNFLLSLIRSALGNDGADLSRFRADWMVVYNLAQVQGVHGVVFDTLDNIQKEMLPPKTVLLNWIGNVAMMERTYDAYVCTIKGLAEIVKKEKLVMMVMKGYGCSLNYPIPNHRPCGDIDIFVMTSEGEHNEKVLKAVDKAITEHNQGKFISDNKHHTVIQYCKFVVENHETILDVNTHKSSRVLNRLLEKLASENKDIYTSLAQGLVLPSVKFNSIHLLRHMANDFATVRITLRQILDWSTFVANNATDIDWDFVHEVARKANMHRFLDTINSICVDYLGYNTALFPIVYKDEMLRDRVLADIFNIEYQDEMPEFKNKLRYGLAKTSRMWHNRWKYNIVYDESLCSSFISKTYNRIIKSWKS